MTDPVEGRPGRHRAGEQELILPPPRVVSPCAYDPGDLPSREELTAGFQRLVAGLNRRNGGLLWWAGPLASRNPFDSRLYESLFRYIHLLDGLRRRGTGSSPPRVAGGDPLIAADLSRACARSGAECEHPPRELARSFRLLGLGISHAFCFILINIYKKILIWIYLGASPGRVLEDREPAYVIRSWLDHRSFDADGRYRDAYFGRLPGYIGASRRLVLVAGVVWTYPYAKALKKIHAQDSGFAIIPQEYFLTLRDIIRAALLPLSGDHPDIMDAVFMGRDVSGIVARAIQEERASLQIRNNLANYYIARRLAGSLPVEAFTYTFENHAFEKMLILGFREVSPVTRITGYQHGGVSRMLHNYFLAEGEAASIPLPDHILTTGEETRDFLVSEGHFPSPVVATGCALRYEDLQGLPVRARVSRGVISVPLPVDTEAARATLDILVQAVGDRPGYSVKLRNHPLVPREDILGRRAGRRLPGNITWAGEGSTRDLLMAGDIVIYTQTTTCIEALMLGIPVVYLDLFTMYDADYILKDIPFRWAAGDPGSLCRALSGIRSLGDAEYAARQREGVAYARRFFTPVDEASMSRFLAGPGRGPALPADPYLNTRQASNR